MLAQQYDGLLRIAPAIPPGWDVDGSVFVRGKTKVNVQTRDGVVTTAVVETGIPQRMRVRNPWPGEPVDVVLGATGRKVVKADASPVLSFQAIAGVRYLMERHAVRTTEQRFVQITGERARSAKRLGHVRIGLDNGS